MAPLRGVAAQLIPTREVEATSKVALEPSVGRFYGVHSGLERPPAPRKGERDDFVATHLSGARTAVEAALDEVMRQRPSTPRTPKT